MIQILLQILAIQLVFCYTSVNYLHVTMATTCASSVFCVPRKLLCATCSVSVFTCAACIFIMYSYLVAFSTFAVYFVMLHRCCKDIFFICLCFVHKACVFFSRSTLSSQGHCTQHKNRDEIALSLTETMIIKLV